MKISRAVLFAITLVDAFNGVNLKQNQDLVGPGKMSKFRTGLNCGQD